MNDSKMRLKEFFELWHLLCLERYERARPYDPENPYECVGGEA